MTKKRLNEINNAYKIAIEFERYGKLRDKNKKSFYISSILKNDLKISK